MKLKELFCTKNVNLSTIETNSFDMDGYICRWSATEIRLAVEHYLFKCEDLSRQVDHIRTTVYIVYLLLKVC
jgi:hypothetical protein